MLVVPRYELSAIILAASAINSGSEPNICTAIGSSPSLIAAKGAVFEGDAVMLFFIFCYKTRVFLLIFLGFSLFFQAKIKAKNAYFRKEFHARIFGAFSL